MPIGPFERDVLKRLAANRNPDSFVGGATVIHQAADSPRQSKDIDLFHDTSESLRAAVDEDVKALVAAGFAVEFTVRQVNYLRATVSRGDEATKLEWVFDSAFRFFPVEADLDLGWRFNFWDAATNKLLAFAGRSTLRDYVDVLYLHECHLSLGALAWAAAGKDPGLTPEMIVEGARRNARFPGEDLAALQLARPVDWISLKQTLHRAADEAATLFAALPPKEIGCFYLDASGKPVCPSPASVDFAQLTKHYGSIKGAWPRPVDA